jgi:ribosomal protein L24E
MNLEQCHQCGRKIEFAYMVEMTLSDILSFCSRKCISRFAEKIHESEEKLA